MNIKSALIAAAVAFSTATALLTAPAGAAPSKSLNVELGSGVEVVATVDLNQTAVREFALPYLRQVRADMYDRNVPFHDTASSIGGNLQDVVAAYGLSRDKYVNGLEWSADLERIAVQRALEEKYSESLDHIRPNGTSAFTAALPNYARSWGENICGWARADLNYCLHAWTYDEEKHLRKANGHFNYDSGHLFNVINPSRSYVAVGATDKYFSSQHSMYPPTVPDANNLDGLTSLSIAVPTQDIRKYFSLRPFNNPIAPGESTTITMRNDNGFDLPGTMHSADSSVATVTGDTVVAVDYGTTTIGFQSTDGLFDDSATLTVADPPAPSSSSGINPLLAIIAIIMATVGIGVGLTGLPGFNGLPAF